MMRFWFVFMSMFLPVLCWGQIIVKETGDVMLLLTDWWQRDN